ncbi:RagB/SusD family nutrient uptake outer membrane protein [Marinoscillum sp. MHG1-6]|uniref:RagB/SusD family nutrient uptake outer membrane protein n=1 Tax=Marinoscillum sp. MHG1-6 TaxID=2959627 RepID=UPI002157C021|nr:RagB/SusD family nutrient uptake outer membrane protein [Marinoscillum sp. MHG1-6]
MKLKYILTIFLASTLMGCGDEFLELTPSNSINSDNFFQTEADAVAAVNGAYQVLQWPNNYNLRVWALDIVAGNAEVGAGGGDDGVETKQLSNFIFATDNPGVEDLWRGIWTGVARANLVMDKVPDMNIDETLKSRLIAEAKFLRALYYFNGARVYGGLPLLPKLSDDLYVERASVEDTYAFVISDLNAAKDVLPVSYDGTVNNEVGRATKGAALALMAKAHLTIGEYAEAEAAAKQVEALGVYDLNFDYSQNFDPNNENGIESVFEVQYSAGAGFGAFDKPHQGAWVTEFTNPRGSGLSAWGGFGWGHVTQEFVDAYEPGDQRLQYTVWQSGDTYDAFTYDPSFSTTGYNIKKWVQGSGSATGVDSDLNFPVIRYADVLLMIAEALNEQGKPGEAAPYIEKVRNRAGLTDDLSGYSQSEMRDAILHERRIEFAFEGQWWFDVLRAGPDYSESFFHGLGKTNFDKTKHILFPIPQTDLDLNPNLEQNPNF